MRLTACEFCSDWLHGFWNNTRGGKRPGTTYRGAAESDKGRAPAKLLIAATIFWVLGSRVLNALCLNSERALTGQGNTDSISAAHLLRIHKKLCATFVWMKKNFLTE